MSISILITVVGLFLMAIYLMASEADSECTAKTKYFIAYNFCGILGVVCVLIPIYF